MSQPPVTETPQSVFPVEVFPLYFYVIIEDDETDDAAVKLCETRSLGFGLECSEFTTMNE